MYQAFEASRIDNDHPRRNPLDQAIGNDAEVFDAHTQTWRTQANRIDSDKARHKLLDQTAGDDAEVFDPNTQTWQPTQSAGNGQYTTLGDAYREAIDFEIKGGWQRA